MAKEKGTKENSWKLKTPPNTSEYEMYKDVKDGKEILGFQSVKEMPCEIPLIIGDPIHNLHAALDLLFCELIRVCGGTVSEWTNFPFRTTRNELIGTINGREIECIGGVIIDLIVDTIKPADYFAYHDHGSASAKDDMLLRRHGDLEMTASKLLTVQ